MKLMNAEDIMKASSPHELFSMKEETLEQEYQEYVDRFKPSAYNTVRNFVVTQRVTILYRKAHSILKARGGLGTSEYELCLTDTNGNVTNYDIHYSYYVKLGEMYVSEDYVIFVVYSRYEKYYQNFIAKANKIPKLQKEIWSKVQYSFPKIEKHFTTSTGHYAIVIKKPCKIYPLREVLNYFEGSLKAEYVASIVTRLCYFVCYMDILGLCHNGITVDNLFFAPGRTVEEGKPFTVDDMRIVGVFGGWFFTSKVEDNIMGLPKEIYDIVPSSIKQRGTSSFVVDMLSVKRVARELLGDVSVNSVPEAMKDWINSQYIHSNAYEEYCKWEQVVIQSFGKHRFVSMDISI